MSSFGLKMFALVLMLIDHLAQFLPGMPIWMHWIGRDWTSVSSCIHLL